MKNLQLLLLLITGFLWIGSCAEDETFNVFEYGESFEIKAGEVFSDSDQMLKVEIATILEDSRCPENVLCEWEGQVRSEILIEIEGQIFTKDLIFRQGRDHQIELENYKFELLKVTPDRQLDENLELEDYTFELVIK